MTLKEEKLHLLLTEDQIRSDIRARLPFVLKSRRNSAVVEEMEICNGKARADMAVISDCLIGIEIKGARDSVKRLPLQAEHYSKCFDHVILVVHECLLNEAIRIVPRWWGVVVGIECNGSVSYELKQRPRRNLYADIESFLKLLWRSEIDTLFERFSSDPIPSRATKKNLIASLVTQAPHKEIRAAGISLMKGRDNWRLSPILDGPTDVRSLLLTCAPNSA